MAQNVYDGLFILDSNRYARDPDGIAALIRDTIEKAGGQILVHRLWEDRRLAYPIKGHRKGAYWLTYFRVESGQINTLRRQFRLAEPILRMLILRVDPRIVDAVVAHAQTATFAAPGEAVEAKASAPHVEKAAVGAIPEDVAEVEGVEDKD